MQARIRQVSLFTAVAVTLTMTLGGTAFAQTVGTWKLNVEKSKVSRGSGAQERHTRV
jgi:hypothetical protein